MIVGVVYLELSKPVPIDWTPTFNENHAKPYGLKVLFEELPELFPNEKIKTVNTTPYEYFYQSFYTADEEYDKNGTYINIKDYNTIDDTSIEELLNYVSKGNNVLLSTSSFSEKLLDTLNLKIRYDYALQPEAELSFTNEKLKNNTITLNKNIEKDYFSKIDSSKTTILGYQKFKDTTKIINFVKVQHNKGAFFLHTQPYVFTNYYLLKDDYYKYPEAILAHLPNKTIHFDAAVKRGKGLSSSPLRFILSQKSLRWGWYIALLTLLLFMIFNAKRKQRIVNIIKPLENTTLAFTKTIGNLYYETKDHNNVVNKKITYFLERIRNDFYLDTTNLDEKFIKNLALKSGKKKNDIEEFITLIIKLNKRSFCTQEDVLQLTKAIDNFYNTK